MDGRIYLQMTDKKYDIIQIDAYRQPYIPFHLVTQEFFQEVYDHLEDDGVLAINVASVRGVSTDLTAMIYRTIREVFPWAIRVKAGRSNDILIASKKPELNDIDFSSLEIQPNHHGYRMLCVAYSRQKSIRHQDIFKAISSEPILMFPIGKKQPYWPMIMLL